MAFLTDTQQKRIIANFLVAFFTTIGAVQITFGDGSKSFMAALTAGFIQGGLAAAQELKRSTEPPVTGNKKAQASLVFGAGAGFLLV